MATDFLAEMEAVTTNWIVQEVNNTYPDALSMSVDPVKGLSLSLALSGSPKITLTDLLWSGGTPSGDLAIAVSSSDNLSLDLFGGLNVALTSFDLSLKPSGMTTIIAGKLDIPFFTNSDGSAESVNVDITIKSDGSFSIALSAQQDKSTPDGQPLLTYDLGVAQLAIAISSLQVTETSGNWSVSFAGSLDITTADIQWPTFDLKGLSLDSQGHVTLDGGWIDLPSQTAISFYGFTIALHKLGFGSDSSGRWIGFNGDIQLVEGISLGGSVQGMKLNLGNGKVSFTGVGIDMDIPDVISFNGEVEHIQLNLGDDPTQIGLPKGFPVPANVFAGHVDVTIEAAGDLEIDGSFVVAQITMPDGSTQTGFFLSLDAELPVGIPLFVDVDLYGLDGLFATNLAPVDPTLSGDTWWDWYKYKSNNGVIDKSGTEYSATDEQKWLNFVPGAFALGAGATIGTQDDGFTASAAIAFILILPGPIISFVGKANILSERIGGATADANFQAMATYDGTTETFDMVVQAQYSIPVVLDIEATAELYADRNGVWFLALGKPPHEQRVKARIFDLFETDAYFVISNTGLVTGTWTGYKNSWNFGPLSASLDAYLATIAAIQWKPLQIAGGIELHGEVQLSAFGISIGITADALLEGTAPNPFWVYGSLQVELDLPWPLPNVGATITLSWGGNDGSVPPAPLALASIDAMLRDHGTSDKYELLTHGNGAWSYALAPGETVVYDSVTPGILAANPTGYWVAKDPNVATDYASVIPDLDPTTLARASVVPQDSHFTLTFAHQINDGVGFTNETSPVPSDLVFVTTPGIVGADDLSNLNPTPPAVQWLIDHTLLEVALYSYDASTSAWDLISAAPQGAALRDLPGVWLASAKTPTATKPNTVLKIVPYTPTLGTVMYPAWGDAVQAFGTHFSDQGVQFDCDPGVLPVVIATSGALTPPGLRFATSVSGANVTITFPTEVALEKIDAVVFEGETYTAPSFSSGGSVVTPVSSWQNPSTLVFTLTFDPSTTVSQIEMPVQNTTYVFGMVFRTPNVKLPMLPQAPAFYALKVVTQIGAGRVDAKSKAAFQPVTDANPVIEFAYFQTACGPGVGTIDAPGAPQSPFVQPPQPTLGDAAAPPPKAFPLGGRLEDLKTYLQWSWPTDGDQHAYYGYDFSAEFNETYAVLLYAALSGMRASAFAASVERESLPLHFRCVDRNNAHTLSTPSALHVPSIPQQSALVAGVGPAIAYPSNIQPPGNSVIGVAGRPQVFEDATRAVARALSGNRLMLSSTEPPVREVIELAAHRVTGLEKTGSIGGAISINPGVGPGILHGLEELRAAEKARALWFKPLLPRTRYRLDVVPGPAKSSLRIQVPNYSYPDYSAIADAPDAIGTLAALEAYLAGEDALASLARVEFATSRYATFADQVANAIAQTSGATGLPSIRTYAAKVDPQAWLQNGTNGDGKRTAAQTVYETARAAIAQVVDAFDPLYDALLSGQTPPTANSNGQTALRLQRVAANDAWTAYANATSASFDGLIAALGRPELQSSTHTPLPPDAEISFFTTNNDVDVVALLLESPEPLLWRRLWAWVELQAQGFLSEVLEGVTVLWNVDGTRALIVPQGRAIGTYVLSMQFQGDIGPEAPCIMLDGRAVDDGAQLAPIEFAPARIIIWGAGQDNRWGRAGAHSTIRGRWYSATFSILVPRQ